MIRGRYWLVGAALCGAALGVTGCGSPAEVKKAQVEDVRASLPEVYAGIEEGDWSARTWVTVPVPNEAEWAEIYADPYFDLAEWEGAANERKRSEALEELKAWGEKASEATQTFDYADEDISNLFQRVVAAKLVEANLLLAEGSARSAAESVREALRMGNDSLKSGPGLEGLNQTVPILMSAQMATLVAGRSDLSAEDRRQLLLDPLGEVDFRTAVERKLREHVVFDVVPRMTNVGRAENVPEMAAQLLAGGGLPEDYLALTEGAWKKDKRVFEASAATARVVEWTEAVIAGLADGWAGVERALALREEELTGLWGVNPFRMDGLDESAVKAPAAGGGRMMEVFFAYDAMQAAVPMVESAVLAQVSVDAAKLSVMMGEAGARGVRIRTWDDLEVLFPGARERLSDPVSGGVYDVDFVTRTLRVSASVPEERIMLSAVARSGVRF